MNLKKILLKFLSSNFLQGCSNLNTLESRRASRGKEKGRNVFEINNIPHAEGKVFWWFLTPYLFVRKHGFPVVLKPNMGGFSRGSFFPIKNYWQLTKSLILVKFYWPRTVIEKYLEGKNYRVTIFNGEIIAACERFAPFVIGDGEKTIKSLIQEENQKRKDMDLYPIMHPIPLDRKTSRYIRKRYGYCFETIPKRNERIYTFYRIALSPGGVIRNIRPEDIPLVNKKLFQRVLQVFDARIFGVDIIMKEGIEIAYDKQECIMLEVNSRPYLPLHEAPRYGDRPNLSKFYQDIKILTPQDADTF